mmetsp:Transcript_2548/g.2168  ORF Transcript_2548/g.2168 Transcript_2548/m.2168 type:complete len:135 (+) Transcript_2548:743-1147(+)|eukprot:CAMPEP_0114577540 /NCGR_PEP_ID=MMETSP0125-20121206/2191_1 /TAXON_ID=485358 ORGANISM="Aristerostoma sp., Strain ATCC 50986" /NCGR_SAMPLE_ID=MMETSP0125 /ASSEMBLY_ACC=CAM_ASM_000245 /LENGTH=134 /DNA_ID=CAMNT_0001766935 /DNA_START=658 /DNA_END=1062 /DNA_ORIENTATION=-
MTRISFEDILVKEETEIKDYHDSINQIYHRLTNNGDFLNEGEFEGFKHLYKNKILKKKYNENFINQLKNIVDKIPLDTQRTENDEEQNFSEYDGDSSMENEKKKNGEEEEEEQEEEESSHNNEMDLMQRPSIAQ